MEVQGFVLAVRNNDARRTAAPVDGVLGTVVDRARLVKGRFANPAAPDEATIGEGLAAELHLGVGSDLVAALVHEPQIKIGFSGGNLESGRSPSTDSRRRDRAATARPRRPAPVGRHRDANSGLRREVRQSHRHLHRHRESEDDRRRRRRLTRRHGRAQALGKAQTFQVQPLGIETQGRGNAIDVLTLALWIFAARPCSRSRRDRHRVDV